MAAIGLPSEEEFLMLGMEIAQINHWRSYLPHTNINRFKKRYGATPLSCTQMWAGLNAIGEVNNTSKPKHFLMCLRYLFKYHTYSDLADFFGFATERPVGKWCKIFVKKIQKLLDLKMLSFEEADDGLIFFLTVDGTVCPIEEPRPFSTIWSSHKLGGDPGLNYEVALSISRAKLVHIHGPTPPGLHNDLQVARGELLPKLRQYCNEKGVERRIIGDGSYGAQEEWDVISIKNEFDPPELAEFKNRASARQEAFNKLLKNWRVLDTVFRGGMNHHKECFEAVAAICCYQIDNGSCNLFEAYPQY
jgi:hypothetical protein